MPIWVMSPLRKVTRMVAYKVLPRYLKKRHRSKLNNSSDVIVSFTSFPARINNVWQIVECMLNQTLQPKEIILWLSKEQFPTTDSVPTSLRDRESEIFKIRMVEGDIRSHKKYYYVVKEHPDALVFLIDDDIYYPTDIIERSVREYERFDNVVVCNYGYRIEYNDDCSHKPYSQWERVYHKAVSSDLFFGSGGGTLFHPSKLCPEITNIEKALELTPTADDIWLNAMAKLSGLMLCLLPNGTILEIPNKGNVTLHSINNGEAMNDEQLIAMENYYGRIFDKIKLFH